MLSNFSICPHCTAKGNSGVIMKMQERTKLISRSDGKSFHLFLFDGPSVWYSTKGSPIAGRSVGAFFYASDRAGTQHGQITVVYRTVDMNQGEVLAAMEESATLIAELLSSGEKPEEGYLFDRGQLSTLPTDERP